MENNGIDEFALNCNYGFKCRRHIQTQEIPSNSPFRGGLVIDEFYARYLIKPLLDAFYRG